ncbi:auxin-induced protein X10A [Cicer arietinum]|uniref:Auxin-responsive protein SAUR72 n=1 Tax=Cicer arietinum TaxID=3827 RepID=A0A1S2YNP1_CICAR|nr:auxin-responsive protein SAUR72 [Cicer arietinum]
MDSKKSNKIREIVRLQQILKKWKKVATNASNNNSSSSSSNSTSSGNKGIKFLKRTLSFNDVSNSNVDIIPKGFLAVCVGKELKRFIIPMDYLKHQAFEVLLQEAENEFGFQQEGVLKIPCQVSMFEKILKVVEDKKEALNLHEFGLGGDNVTPTHHAQVCR